MRQQAVFGARRNVLGTALAYRVGCSLPVGGREQHPSVCGSDVEGNEKCDGSLTSSCAVQVGLDVPKRGCHGGKGHWVIGKYGEMIGCQQAKFGCEMSDGWRVCRVGKARTDSNRGYKGN